MCFYTLLDIFPVHLGNSSSASTASPLVASPPCRLSSLLPPFAKQTTEVNHSHSQEESQSVSVYLTQS